MEHLAHAGVPSALILLGFCVLGSGTAYLVLRLNGFRGASLPAIALVVATGTVLGLLWWSLVLPHWLHWLTVRGSGSSLHGVVEVLVRLLGALGHGLAFGLVYLAVFMGTGLALSYPLRRVTGLDEPESIGVSLELVGCATVVFTIAMTFGWLALGARG